MQKFLHNL